MENTLTQFLKHIKKLIKKSLPRERMERERRKKKINKNQEEKVIRKNVFDGWEKKN